MVTCDSHKVVTLKTLVLVRFQLPQPIADVCRVL